MNNTRTERPRRWLAVAAAVLAGLTAAVAPTGPAAAADTPYTHAIFTDPTGDTAAKDRIYTRLVELIDGAEAGSTISVSMYYFYATTIPNALVAAKGRGVKVRVVADVKTVANTASYDVLRTGLGTDTTQASFFTTCPSGRGCIAGYDYSINHNKFFLFSRTLGVDDVVVQTTANMGGTAWRDGGTGWNDALEVTGNAALFDSYTGYFGDLAAKKVNNNYYDTRVPVQAGAAKVFYYPRAGDTLYGDPSEDTVMTILNNTECFGNTTVGVQSDGTHRTIIRVTVTEFALDYIADKLVALDKAGCYVLVNLRYDPDNTYQTTALKSLLAKTTDKYNGVIVRYYCDSDPIWIHSKNFSIEGKYYGKGDRKIVWTGSLNWKGGSLRGSDEVMLQMENPEVHAAYAQQYNAVAAAATHKPANGAAPAC
ncbi:Phosphatidylserine/phosphatidylglycerophosphate/cardiolipin synthase [Actinoplanes regularis]|uniref:phospholipase D n=1 Tax=Actinoplanes regularis TaxID=52697 RepID=A0A239JI63_9ACTN|nr:hypothetical protein Are01nite_84910 [Actinoplanes regularis]SNT05003.1 Phosphatidylserine/phosphatidylglycerophosphate/cardiolipin synthase [Actinoplanes regularis]